MIHVRRQLPQRGTDAWGSGAFRASRGDREHKGIDYESVPGDAVYSPVKGIVTKLGYPYTPSPKDKITYQYVEVTDPEGNRHRVFYVAPAVSQDVPVTAHSVIGYAQDIAARYTTPDKAMKNHVHYEIIDRFGNLVDPEGMA